MQKNDFFINSCVNPEYLDCYFPKENFKIFFLTNLYDPMIQVMNIEMEKVIITLPGFKSPDLQSKLKCLIQLRKNIDSQMRKTFLIAKEGIAVANQGNYISQIFLQQPNGNVFDLHEYIQGIFDSLPDWKKVIVLSFMISDSNVFLASFLACNKDSSFKLNVKDEQEILNYSTESYLLLDQMFPNLGDKLNDILDKANDQTNCISNIIEKVLNTKSHVDTYNNCLKKYESITVEGYDLSGEIKIIKTELFDVTSEIEIMISSYSNLISRLLRAIKKYCYKFRIDIPDLSIDKFFENPDLFQFLSKNQKYISDYADPGENDKVSENISFIISRYEHESPKMKNLLKRKKEIEEIIKQKEDITLKYVQSVLNKTAIKKNSLDMGESLIISNIKAIEKNVKLLNDIYKNYNMQIVINRFFVHLLLELQIKILKYLTPLDVKFFENTLTLNFITKK